MLALLASLALVLAPGTLDVTVAARAIQPGELVVLTITGSEAPTNVRVSVFGKSVPMFEGPDHRWEALVGIDLDQKPGRYTASIDAVVSSKPVHVSRTLVVIPKKFPTRSLTVDPAFVNPSAADLARIEADNRILRDVYANSSRERLWSEAFVRPVGEAATSRFGSRSIFNGAPRSPHSGTDFLSPAGAPVHAPNAGRIVAARAFYFTGNTVIIDHGLGVFSLLAHLSRLDVREGDMVAAGQVVGLVGATGRVTGPHLHWAFRVSGARVDGLSALAVLGHD